MKSHISQIKDPQTGEPVVNSITIRNLWVDAGSVFMFTASNGDKETDTIATAVITYQEATELRDWLDERLKFTTPQNPHSLGVDRRGIEIFHGDYVRMLDAFYVVYKMAGTVALALVCNLRDPRGNVAYAFIPHLCEKVSMNDVVMSPIGNSE